MKTTNILVIGNYDRYNNELLAFLNTSRHFRITGIFENAARAISLYSLHSPEVVFIDAYQEGFNGFEVARFILEQDPTIRIIMVSEDESSALSTLSFEMGLYGYVSKNFETVLLSQAVTAIQANRRFFPDLGQSPHRFI